MTSSLEHLTILNKTPLHLTQIPLHSLKRRVFFEPKRKGARFMGLKTRVLIPFYLLRYDG